MIDAVLSFPSAAAARNDPVLAAHLTTLQSWVGSYVLPGIRLWRNSQDVAGTDADGNPKITHTYLPGWSILISRPNVVGALRNHANLQFMVDSDAGTVIRATINQTVMQDIRMEPIFAGRNYPWGAWT